MALYFSGKKSTFQTTAVHRKVHVLQRFHCMLTQLQFISLKGIKKILYKCGAIPLNYNIVPNKSPEISGAIHLLLMSVVCFLHFLPKIMYLHSV